MQQLILILHVLACFAIIALVLLQHGKGADVGASFGSGGSNTMFGSAGTVPFLMKLTASIAALFFITSLTLGYMARSQMQQTSSVYDISAPKITLPTNAMPNGIPGQEQNKK